MAITERCCLVFWGVHCDETAVAVLVSTLRAAGLRVWLVGVSGSHLAGTHGIRLQPDLTPSEALLVVHRAICLVLPCTHSVLARFVNDPRVDELLRAAQQAQARFVVSPVLTNPMLLGLVPYNLATALTYPQGTDLFVFATTLSALLTAEHLCK